MGSINELRAVGVPDSVQIGADLGRQAFWKYCARASNAAKLRSAQKGIPCNIDAHYLDTLLVDAEWRCAVSGTILRPPSGRRDPFAPSLDRIIPIRGYVRGNVRIVCAIVNQAMSDWGLEALQALVIAMKATGTAGERP